MTQSIKDIQEALIEDLSFFDSWEDKYRYLIDLGRKLPAMPDHLRCDSNLVKGCQSRVWLSYHREEDLLYFQANSDAAIVSGLIAILLRVFSGQTARNIVDAPLDFIATMELSQHLSPMRSNGLASMLKAIRKIAAQEA